MNSQHQKDRLRLVSLLVDQRNGAPVAKQVRELKAKVRRSDVGSYLQLLDDILKPDKEPAGRRVSIPKNAERS